MPNCNDSVNLFLLRRCDLHDRFALRLPIEFSQIRQLRQYKVIWSCVLVLSSASTTQAYFCLAFPNIAVGFPHCSLSVFCKALLLASELPTFNEHFSLYARIRHRRDQKIPRNLLALSSFGFSMIHFCLCLRFDVSDICFHISGHNLSGLEVVCFLVNLSPDHENPSGGLSFNKMNLVKSVHASDNSLSPSTFQ